MSKKDRKSHCLVPSLIFEVLIYKGRLWKVMLLYDIHNTLFFHRKNRIWQVSCLQYEICLPWSWPTSTWGREPSRPDLSLHRYRYFLTLSLLAILFFHSFVAVSFISSPPSLQTQSHYLPVTHTHSNSLPVYSLYFRSLSISRTHTYFRIYTVLLGWAIRKF